MAHGIITNTDVSVFLLKANSKVQLKNEENSVADGASRLKHGKDNASDCDRRHAAP